MPSESIDFETVAGNRSARSGDGLPPPPTGVASPQGLLARLRALTLRAIVRNDAVWRVFDRNMIAFADDVRSERKRSRPAALNQVSDSAVRAMSPDLVVKHGIFAGMRYPAGTAIGSTVFPKLLGSYERELQPLFERLCQNAYSEVVDIGCAEGYYAVGLALRIPTARVFAFDTNADATRLCQTMAATNGVGDRVTVGGLCDPPTLLRLPLSTRALIVSDCEGYEKTLFTRETAPLFARHDVLIETHDFVDLSISGTIREVFRHSHEIEEIRSVDDIEKAQEYDYPELEGYNLDVRRRLLAERRPAIMKWLYLTPAASCR